MQILKTILSIILIAALLLAAVVGIFWEQLLSPEQKLRYGREFSAVEDLRQLSAADPANQQRLADYVAGLVVEGNVGRASYLSEMYGVDNSGAAALRELALRSLQASTDGQVLDITAEPEAQQFIDTPAWEVLRYLEGYRHALSGDWMSARNEFMAIKNGELPEPLRGWHKYYLARSYRYGGDDAEKQQVQKILAELLKTETEAGREGGLLHGRTLYNLIDWQLAADYAGTDGPKLANARLTEIDKLQEAWAQQKSLQALGEHSLATADPGRAWELAQRALLLDPAASGGKGSGALALDSLSGVLGAFSNKGNSNSPNWQPQEEPLRPLMDASGELQLEMSVGTFRALADWAVANQREADTAALLIRLRPHVAARDAWEELRIGEAICYGGAADLAAMRTLVNDPNVATMSAASRAEIHYEYGMLLRGQSEWNTALTQLRRSGELGGPRGSDAWFQAYLVLKRVQDPLNVDSSIQYLQRVVDGSALSESYPRAFEELVPLLIHSGSRSAARQLCERVLEIAGNSLDGMDSERSSELATVARYWLAWIAREDGDLPAANSYRKGIELRHWNYYEVTAGPDIEPLTVSAPELVALPESAGEYFAGLGLTTNAAEILDAEGLADSQLLAYFRIANNEPVMELPGVQWRATEILESGVVREAALLDYVLQKAYPRPFDDVVLPAAQEFGVEPALIYAVIKKESNFKPADISWAGAEGLMQLMPESAKWLNERYSLGVDLGKLRDPKQNVRLGAANLSSLYDQLGQGNIRGVIIAHNKGAGNYKKWTGRYGSDPILISELVPNEENEGFIKRVLRYYLIYSWLEER